MKNIKNAKYKIIICAALLGVCCDFKLNNTQAKHNLIKVNSINTKYLQKVNEQTINYYILNIKELTTKIQIPTVNDLSYFVNKAEEQMLLDQEREYKIYLLSHLIYAEAGSDTCSDEEQRAVASVALNRVYDDRFPETLTDVIYQEGQYVCIKNESFYIEPNQRAIDNATYVIDNGATVPSSVVWQSQEIQGNGVYVKIGKHYFCY